MKACFIIEYYYPNVGGAEVLFQRLAEGLVEAGHTCHVVTCRLPDTKKHETINGVHIHRVRVPKLGDRFWFIFLSFFAGWKYASKADIIHTRIYTGAFAAWLLSKVHKKRVVNQVFEVMGKKWYEINLNPIAAFSYRVLESLVFFLPFDSYFCISKNTMKLLIDRRVPPQKLCLIYPGIDYDLFDSGKNGERGKEIRNQMGLGKEDFLYTFYGRPGFTKGVEYLVRSVPYVKESIPSSRLLLILSRRPERGYQRILELIQKLELKDGQDVILMDSVPREELPWYIQASDCVVVPSLSEGFGFTCVEACTMKVPVVSTDAGALPEVIFGRHVIVRQGDPVALARGIEKIYHREYTLSKDKVYSWKDAVKNCVKAYEHLISP
jgi:glycosyltransferase involved in cell wall biosynthesis